MDIRIEIEARFLPHDVRRLFIPPHHQCHLLDGRLTLDTLRGRNAQLVWRLV